MSPRHFAKANSVPLNKDVLRSVEGHKSLWFAFTTVTGIAKLFSYTPEAINNNPVKDLAKGQGK